MYYMTQGKIVRFEDYNDEKQSLRSLGRDDLGEINSGRQLRSIWEASGAIWNHSGGTQNHPETSIQKGGSSP